MDKTELYQPNNLIHRKIRNFRDFNFEKENDRNAVWNVAKRLNGSRNVSSIPIQEKDGLHYKTEGKSAAIADCVEDQFKANDTADNFRDHYREVIRIMHKFRSTGFEPSVIGNEMRKIIKNLQPKRAPGHDGVTNSKILSCCYVTSSALSL